MIRDFQMDRFSVASLFLFYLGPSMYLLKQRLNSWRSANLARSCSSATSDGWTFEVMTLALRQIGPAVSCLQKSSQETPSHPAFLAIWSASTVLLKMTWCRFAKSKNKGAFLTISFFPTVFVLSLRRKSAMWKSLMVFKVRKIASSSVRIPSNVRFCDQYFLEVVATWATTNSDFWIDLIASLASGPESMQIVLPTCACPRLQRRSVRRNRGNPNVSV